MKKKNYLLLLATVLFSPFVITSCSDDDDPTPDPTPAPTPEAGISGAYILNTGSMGVTSGTLDFYDFETEALNENVFEALNGRKLGDTANDMLIYGSKIYITVTDASTIEVVDLDGKSLKQIQMKDDAQIPQKPRYLSADKGKIYVSTQDGNLSQIDTTTLAVEKQVKVGLGIEQHCVVGNTIYSTVYGSYTEYDNKVIAVDLTKFEVTDTIEVVVNPNMIQAGENGMLYVLSFGNYADIKQTLQRVNPKTKERKELLVNSNLSMTKSGDYLYIVSGTVDENWIKTSTEYKKYNLKTDQFEANDFVQSDIAIDNATYAYANPTSNEVYVTAGDYQNTGNVYLISKEGALVKEIPVSGINPSCVRFLSK